MTGTVTRFNARGFGFIAGDGDARPQQEYFVHFRDVEGKQHLRPGDRVEFEVVEDGGRLPHAVEVRVLARIAAP